MTAIQAYVLAKKFAQQMASGISGITYEDGKLNFTLTGEEPTTISIEVPMPEDGVSVTDIHIDKETGHLTCTLSNGQEIDAGEPTVSADLFWNTF